jgi:hypothetical protein
MNSPAEQELTATIHEVEKVEHDLEDRVESLKRQDEELDAPDAISKSLKDGRIVRSHMRAPHLGD